MNELEETHNLRAEASEALEEALNEIKRVIVGQDAMLERLLVSLLAGGHVLLEGVPGLAMTLTVKTLAAVLGGSYGRIQFTPDLVPADLVGTRVYHPDTHGAFDAELAGRVPLQLPARRRDQPGARQGAVGAARGHAGAAGDDRRHDVRGPAALHCDGHPEPDRIRGDLPASRGAGVDRFLMKVLVDYPSLGEEAAVVGAQPGRASRCPGAPVSFP